MIIDELMIIKNVKRILFGIVSILAIVIFAFTPVYAVDDICDDIDSSTMPNYDIICGGGDEQDMFAAVSNVLNTVYFWVGIIAVIVIIISGVFYMTSQGDPGKIKRAKDALKFSIIGLVIVLLAFAITNFIIRAIIGDTTGSSSTITPAVAVESITVSVPKSTAKIGEKIELEVSFNPNNATNKNLSYSSSNTEVASVSANGIVKGKKAGTTTITVTSRNGKTATIDVTILPPIEATGVTVSPTSIKIKVGKSQTVTATVKPDDTDDKSLTWSSADSSIASVSASGKIQGKKAGKTKVTVKTKNGKTATVDVEVVEGSESTLDTTPGTSDRYKIGNMLSGMHAADDGNIDKTQQAVNKKYWAVECDLQLRNGTLYCYHDSSYFGSNTATFADTMKVCKNGGTRVIIDLKDSSSAALAQLSSYIKANNLQKWVIVQTNEKSAMESLNSRVGSKLEYWGLIMSDSSTLEHYISNASTYRALGMTALNMPKYASGWTVGSEANIRRAQAAGYDVGIFTWTSFSDADISRYQSLGVKYLMTNSISQ